jgi:hypothetical protein
MEYGSIYLRKTCSDFFGDRLTALKDWGLIDPYIRRVRPLDAQAICWPPHSVVARPYPPVFRWDT